MLIGELSKRSGLTRDTIRFYEKENLIEPGKKGRTLLQSNTYKNYPESTVATLTFIQRTKVLGFTLAEIKEMLRLREPGQKTGKKWAAQAEVKLLSVDQKIEELKELKKLLGEALARCSDQCFDAGCELLDGAIGKKPGLSPKPSPENGSQCDGGGGSREHPQEMARLPHVLESRPYGPRKREGNHSASGNASIQRLRPAGVELPGWFI